MISQSALPYIAYAKSVEPLNPVTSVAQAGSEPPGGPTKTNVDMFTGKVNLSIPLDSLGHPGSPTYSLSLKYNSNTLAGYQTWNVEIPANDTGMGWSLSSHSKILRYSNGTGNENDDTFYWVNNGEITELIYTYGSSGVDNYTLKNRITNMIFQKENVNPGRWLIIATDGTKYVYGGNIGKDQRPPNPSTTPAEKALLSICKNIYSNYTPASYNGAMDCDTGPIELGVTWGNWIGPSQQPKNQEHQEIAWHLSAIEDTWGNQTKLSYVQVVQAVGPDAKALRFSKAAYLYKVEQKNGEILLLNYMPRIKGTGEDISGPQYAEYTDPWQINGEPDGYQERLRTLYVDSVDHYNHQSKILKRSQLNYDFLVSKNQDPHMAKRTLMEINFYSYSEHLQSVRQSPGYAFTYWDSSNGVYITRNGKNEKPFNAGNGALYGAIKSVTTPAGATVTYTYKANSLPIDRRIALPTAIKDRQILFGHDYALVIGSNQQAVHYSWDQNGWNKNDLFYIMNPNCGDDVCRTITLQKNVIGFSEPKKHKWLPRVNTYTVRKDPLSGMWNHFQYLGNPTNPKLINGKNFFAFKDDQNILTVFSSNTGKEITTLSNVGDNVVAGPDYLITTPVGHTPQFMTHVFDTKTKSFLPPYSNTANYLHVQSSAYTRGICYLYGKCKMYDQTIPGSDIILTALPEGVVSKFKVTGTYEGYDEDHRKIVWTGGIYYKHGLNIFTNKERSATINNGAGVIITQNDFDVYKNANLFSVANGSALTFGLAADGRDLSKAKSGSLCVDDIWNGYDFSRDIRFYKGTSASQSSLAGCAGNFIDSTDFGFTYNLNGSGEKKFYSLNPKNSTFADTGNLAQAPSVHLHKNEALEVIHGIETAAGYIFIASGFLDFPIGTIISSTYLGFIIATEVMHDTISVDPVSLSFNKHFVQDGNTVWFRNTPNNSFDALGTLTDKSLTSHQFATTSNYLPFSTNDNGTIKSYITLLRNGTMGKTIDMEQINQVVNDTNEKFATSKGPMFLTYAKNNDKKLQSSTGDWYLHRFITDNAVGNITDYVVDQVQVQDGETTYKTGYTFETSTAGFNGTGMYAKSREYPGAVKDGANYVGSFTEHHYFSGGNPEEEDINVDFCAPDHTCVPKKVSDLKALMSGKLYKIITYPPLGSTAGYESLTNYRVIHDAHVTENEVYKILVKSVDKTTDGVIKTVRYIYNEKNQLANKTITNTIFDPIAKQVQPETLVTNYRYAWEKYPQMKSKSMLSQGLISYTSQQVGTEAAVITSASRTTYKNWSGPSEEKWAPESHYQANKENPDVTLTDPIGSDYTIVNKVLEREPASGGVLKKANIDGVVSQTWLSTDGELLPIATFRNAAASADGKGDAGYFGGEAYEQQLYLNDTAQVDSVISYTGKRSIKGINSGWHLGPSPTEYQPESERRYIVSAWVKPDDSQDASTCSVGFGTEKTTSSNQNIWQYIEHVSGIISGTVAPPQLTCQQANSRVDDFRYGPVDSTFSATVYDVDRSLVDANIGVNGVTIKNVYDKFGHPYLSYGNLGDGQSRKQTTGGLLLGGWSRFGGFDSDLTVQETDTVGAHNSTAAISIGAKEDLIYDEANNITESKLSGVDAGPRFVLHVLATPTGGASGANPTIYIGDQGKPHLTLQYNPAAFNFDLRQGGSTVATSENLPGTPTKITLVVMDQAAFVFANSKLVLAKQGLTLIPESGSHINSYGYAMSHITFGKAPKISMEYFDNLHRSLQSQALHLQPTTTDGRLETSVIETIYDGWGNAAVSTKSAAYTAGSGALDLFGYRNNFVQSFNWSSGAISGDVVEYYKSGAGHTIPQQPNDYQYPYNRTTFQNSIMNRVKQASNMPGDDFKIDGALTNKLKYQSDDDRRFMTAVGIPSTNNKFHGQTIKQPFDMTKHVLNQRITDDGGRSVSTRVGTAADGYLQTANAYEYNLNEFGKYIARKISHLQPNYFDDTILYNTAYYQTLTKIDVLGRHTTVAVPDKKNESHIIHDNAGRVRFTRLDPDFSTGLIQGFSYNKYDKLGRIIENGVLKNVSGDADFYLTMANDSSYPDTTHACIQNRYVYDTGSGDGTDRYQGRLFMRKVENDDIPDKPTTSCSKTSSPATEVVNYYQYDLWGQVSVSGVQVNGELRNTGYEYNNIGKLIRLTYPTHDKITADSIFDISNQTSVVYSYNVLGQLKSISDAQIQATYVKLEALSDYSGLGWISGAVINILDAEGTPIYDMSFWEIGADSEEDGHSAGLLLDNNPTTFWHSRIPLGLPHDVVIDLGESRPIRGFRYIPVSEPYMENFGYIKDYKFYSSQDGINWMPLKMGVMAEGAIEIAFASSVYADDFVYTIDNQVNSYKANNGKLIHTQTYDFQGRLVNISVEENNAPTVFTESIDYDYNNIVTVPTTSPVARDGAAIYADGYPRMIALDGSGLKNTQHSYGYSYDIWGRLKTAVRKAGTTNGQQYEYTYDRNGNIEAVVEKNGQGQITDNRQYNYVTGKNQLENIDATGGKRNFFYNASGGVVEMTADTTQQVLIRRQEKTDRVLGVTKNDIDVTYKYDALGRRINKIIDTVFTPSPGSCVEKCGGFSGKCAGFGDCCPDKAAVCDGANAKVVKYNYGIGLAPLVEEQGDGGQKIYIYGSGGVPLATLMEGQVYYTLSDHLGSARVIVDEKNIAVGSFEYDSYGKTTVQPAAGKDSLLNEFSFRYTGQRYEPEIDLYAFPARLYDPTVGRFLSTDPTPSEPTPYAYAGNNPISRVDMTGMAWRNSFWNWMGKTQFRRFLMGENFCCSGAVRFIGKTMVQSIAVGLLFYTSSKLSGIVNPGSNAFGSGDFLASIILPTSLNIIGSVAGTLPGLFNLSNNKTLAFDVSMNLVLGATLGVAGYFTGLAGNATLILFSTIIPVGDSLSSLVRWLHHHEGQLLGYEFIVKDRRIAALNWRELFRMISRTGVFGLQFGISDYSAMPLGIAGQLFAIRMSATTIREIVDYIFNRLSISAYNYRVNQMASFQGILTSVEEDLAAENYGFDFRRGRLQIQFDENNFDSDSDDLSPFEAEIQIHERPTGRNYRLNMLPDVEETSL